MCEATFPKNEKEDDVTSSVTTSIVCCAALLYVQNNIEQGATTDSSLKIFSKDVVAMRYSSPTRERAVLQDASAVLEVRVLNDDLLLKALVTP